MKKFFTLFLSFILIFSSGCNAKDTFFYFDCPISLVFYKKSDIKKYSSDIEDILNEIQNATDIENIESDISRFNSLNVGESIKISEITKELISISLNMFDITDGAFNPLIYPLTYLWQFSAENYKTAEFILPTPEQIENAKQLCDITGIKLEDNVLTKINDGVKLDVGGITKGFASDKIYDYLAQKGLKQGYITMGSSTILLFEKKDEIDWNVSIKHPDNPNELLISIPLSNTHVSTSGTYERFYNYNGATYSHIIDANTGFPINNGMKSATVICKNSAFADALSTALCVMGSEKAISFIDNYNKTHTEKITVILAFTDNGSNYCYTNAENYELLDKSYVLIK